MIVNQAVALLERLGFRQLHPDARTFAAVASACAKGRSWSGALWLDIVHLCYDVLHDMFFQRNNMGETFL